MMTAFCRLIDARVQKRKRFDSLAHLPKHARTYECHCKATGRDTDGERGGLDTIVAESHYFCELQLMGEAVKEAPCNHFMR